VPYSRLRRSLRATFTGMATNLLLAAIKLAAGIFGHSHALVADAVESFADVFSSLIVWRGLVVAAQPADRDHPYGHGKAEPLSAAFVSVLLLGAAGWIAVKSVDEISNPHQSPAPFTLIVLVAVVLTKELLFRHIIRIGNAVESSAVTADAWHHRSDAITSVAAGIGITVALIGGQRYASADDWAALAAASVIAWNGARLLRLAADELMDKSPDESLVQRVRAAALDIAGADDVEKCFVRKMGYHYFVDLHVEVDPEISVRRSHEIAHEVKDHIRRQFSNVRDVLVHIEPRRDPRENTENSRPNIPEG